MTRSAATTLALAAGLAACGPYPDVAQKLDVTTPIVTDSETWIAAAGTEVRVLVLGKPADGGEAEFAFTAMQMDTSAGTSATALRGIWRDDGGGAATFDVRVEYTLPDERGKGPLARVGTSRADVARPLHVGFLRGTSELEIGGEPSLAGRYVLFQAALARLGITTAEDAACAFQVGNLGIRSSEVRIIGFGGAAMTQYFSAETYVGTLAGTLRVSLDGSFTSGFTTTIAYSGFVDLAGVRVDGPQITDANAGGNGHMAGTMSFALEPLVDGRPAAPIAGTIDFGGAGDPADAVQISDGTASGGVYVVALAGGATARVSPVTAPTPSVAECLALP
jgi:hypothetical protein